MEYLSDRIKSLSVSQTLAMAQKSRELKAKGIDIISLSLGEPDFNTPDYIKEAAKRAIDENYTKYPPVPGYNALRDAISEKFREENGLTYTSEQIIVSAGGKHSLINVILSIINPGEEVIILAPYWVSYYDQVILAGGKPVVVEGLLENDFKIRPEHLESAITNKTRLIILIHLRIQREWYIPEKRWKRLPGLLKRMKDYSSFLTRYMSILFLKAGM
jgi:aspartate aminotransferase